MNGFETLSSGTAQVEPAEAAAVGIQAANARAVGTQSPKDAAPPKKGYVLARASTKIHDQHRERLAVVYVRQSTQNQVIEHRESLARQYALRDDALALGWKSDRVLVIDEDLGLSGRSANERHGFQRLLTEVTMDHVGIVSGLEMSRLARSSKDWHQLFELCGVFGTLLADEDGVYDPNDPNDRLLLGLKGIMSEVELHTMRCRLERGKLNKAQRGELLLHVPVGYVKTTNGGAAFDPDEQARAVVHLIFDKFNELGSVCEVFRYLRRHGIKMGIRPIEGPNRGQLEWRAPSRSLLFGMLHHPMYAGVYAYGRCPVEPKRRRTHKRARAFVPINEWKVTLHDQMPAYITWDQYQSNQERLTQNLSRLESKGRPRQGTALLGGLLYCGGCNGRLNVAYGCTGKGRYECVRHLRHGTPPTCHGMTCEPLDTLVTQQVLKALEPASIELGAQAAENIHRERERLNKHWKQSMERARYEADRAERCYRAVDPENRLVARTLEQQWEAALGQERQTREDFERFQRDTPDRLSDAEQKQIRELSREIPELWHAPETTPADRKAIIQCLIDRVVASPRANSEFVDVTIHWSGGYVSQHVVRRPVLRYQQLEDYPRMVALIQEAHAAGRTSAQIAEQMNQEGFHAPLAPNKKFTKDDVCNLFRQLGIRRPLLNRDRLQPDEWWREDLAHELRIHPARLHNWVRKGYVHARRDPKTSKFWILWADADELQRLRQLRDYLQTERRVGYPAELKRPKPRPDNESANGRSDEPVSDAGQKPPLADSSK